MRNHILTAVSFMVLIIFTAGCAGGATIVSPTGPATTVGIDMPASTPTVEAVNQIEFDLEIKGDPNPLSLPAGIATDAQGNLYVMDSKNNRIQVFDPTGKFLKCWGSEGNGDGQFQFYAADSDLPGEAMIMGGIAIDSQGNVYVADGFNARIQKFTSDGQFLSKFGTQGTNDGQFVHVRGVAVDPQGNIYVADTYRDDIQKFDSTGKFLKKWGGNGKKAGQFSTPAFLAVDGESNVYVVDTGNSRIEKFDNNGNLLSMFGSEGMEPGQLGTPFGIALDSAGNIYVSEDGNNRVQMFDPNGKFLRVLGTAGNGAGQFSKPMSIAIDSQGNIYVADTMNNRVQKFHRVQ